MNRHARPTYVDANILVAWVLTRPDPGELDPQGGDAAKFEALTGLTRHRYYAWSKPGALTLFWRADEVITRLGHHPYEVYGNAWWPPEPDLEVLLRLVRTSRYWSDLLGFLIEEKRQTQGLSLRALAAHLEVDHVLLHRIEKGRSLLRPGTTLDRLVAWLQEEP